jgi:hypothetical protein
MKGEMASTKRLMRLHRAAPRAVGLTAALALLMMAPAGAEPRAERNPGAAAGAERLNRLANEASPYLRQHATNPVDWYPWGPEAFEKAKREGKPIFLSIGYSTCHWCHVMARESFSDPSIADELRQHVVAIKVDRERHPDLDHIYQQATEIVTRQSGWPNSVFLTPDLRPFFAALYQQPDEFRDTIRRVGEAWHTQRSIVEKEAQRLSRIVTEASTTRRVAQSRSPDALARSTQGLVEEIDPFNGGLGVAPKFPREPVLLLLLQRAERHGDARALAAVRLTLDAILQGGITDQLGGGFHRYAVDEAWRVPHFEKMLYTQALMAQVLARAWRATGEPRYAHALRATLDFVLDDMTLPDGGFASALDAETEGKEGLYYLWTLEEVRAALGDDAAFAIKAFGVTVSGGIDGRNVLHLPEPVVEQAAAERIEPAVFSARLDGLRRRLLAARKSRPAPRLDGKVLASWNGLMIRALAEAGSLLGETRYVHAAKRAASFLTNQMATPDGRLSRVWFEGRADLAGTQADHVFAALGMLALHDATGDDAWRGRAVAIAGQMMVRFEDPGAGDYFSTEDAESFVHLKQRDDTELPSGNAAALELFLMLAQRHAAPEWRHRAVSLAAALSSLSEEPASSHAYALRALDVMDHGEVGHLQHAGRGHVRARLERATHGLSVVLDIADGWHVNASKPLEEFLIPTKVTVDGIDPGAVRYPQPLQRTLGFNANAMALYEGRVEIRIETAPGGERRQVRLDLQTCGDKVCLDPESVVLIEPPRPAD